MRVVLDTNVVVSGLLTPSGPCARLLDAVRAGRLTPLADERTFAELEEFLGRPRLGLPAEIVEVLLRALRQASEHIACRPLPAPLPDPDDEPFLEIALSGAADALVTGNVRHFPGAPVIVLTPRQLVSVLSLDPP